MNQQNFYGFWGLVIGIVGIATDVAASPRSESLAFHSLSFRGAARSSQTIAQSTNISTEGWYDYSPRNGRYRVKFPSEPQTQDEIQVILDRGAKAYLVRLDEISIPRGAEIDTDVILDGARGGLAASGEIERERSIESNGVAGRELVVVGEEGKILKARVFFDPQSGRLFQAIAGAVDGELPSGTDAFLESFEILR